MNFRSTLLLVVASLCSFNIQAAGDRWFDVEILVFKRNVDVQKLSEQLDQNNVYIKKRDRLEVLKAKQATNCLGDNPCLHEQNPVQITDEQMVSGGHRLQRLSSNHLQLKSQLNRLKNHQLFKPLLHVAWRMPVQSKQNALPIHLFAGENYALDIYKEEIIAQKRQEAADAAKAQLNNPQETDPLLIAATDKLDVLDELQKDNAIRDLYEIDGNFLLYVQRYLEIESQLIVRTETQKEVSSSKSVLANPQLETDISGTADDAVQVVDQALPQQRVKTKTVVTETLFDQTRRLRSGEIHYLDHPLFGMIVQIRKIR
ncbi:peptidoglycan binding protein CsiV [Vibrio sp. 1-Bac 57]